MLTFLMLRFLEFPSFPLFIFLINIDFPVAENARRKHWCYNQQLYIYNVSDDVYILWLAYWHWLWEILQVFAMILSVTLWEPDFL